MLVQWIKRKRYSKNIFIVGFSDGSKKEFTDETVAKYAIKPQSDFDTALFDNILAEDEKRRALDSALNILSYNARGTKELAQKLKKNSFSELSINLAVSKLKSLGYINDANYAANTALKRKQQKKGPKYVINELLHKGIAQDLVNKSVSEAFSRDDERSIIKEVVQKKLPALKKLSKEKIFSRLSGFLVRQGFSNDLIIDVLRKEIKGLEMEES